MNEHKALILTFEFPPHPGGIGTYSYQMAENFYRLGIPVEVLARPSIDRHSDDSEFDRAQEFQIQRFRRWSFPFVIASGRVLETLMFVRKHEIKWIFCCSQKAAYAALLCKIMLGIPYFLIGHGSDYARPSLGTRLIVKNARGLFANSNYTARLMNNIQSRRVEVIPLGADSAYFNPIFQNEEARATVRRKYRIHGGPVLLSVGRLNPRKGHDVTLRALCQVKKDYPHVMLVIVGKRMPGEESYDEKLQEYVRDNALTDNVRFIPFVTQEDLRDLYDVADVFVLSSRNAGGDVEGFGISLIEANLMNTPVVAANSGGIPDAVENGKSGLLYECEDTADLVSKVRFLLENETARRKLGEYGRERATQEYNWQVVAQKTWQAIHRLIDVQDKFI